jgi:hypothetical protein
MLDFRIDPATVSSHDTQVNGPLLRHHVELPFCSPLPSPLSRLSVLLNSSDAPLTEDGPNFDPPADVGPRMHLPAVSVTPFRPQKLPQ